MKIHEKKEKLKLLNIQEINLVCMYDMNKLMHALLYERKIKKINNSKERKKKCSQLDFIFIF